MCCVTGAWAVTGSGTEADPYVVQDGDTYTIPAQSTVYISFTPTEDGTLNLAQSAWGMFGWMVKGSGDADFGQWTGMKEDWGDSKSTDFPAMKAGETYIIKNNGVGWSDETITVTFSSNADDPNAFTVTADPAEGSVLGHVAEGETALTFTTSKPIAYIAVRINGSEQGYMTEVPATPVGEGTPVLDAEGNPVIFVDQNDPSNTYELKAYTEWTVGPSFIKVGMTNDWDFYEGEEYTFTFTSYEDRNGWYNIAPLFSTTLTYTGSVPPTQYSDIILENVTPSPDATDPADMASSENPVARFTFSGLVDVKEVALALGQGMGNVPLSYESGEENGKTYVDVTLEGSANQSYITVYVEVVDKETGYGLNDEDGLYSQYFSASNSAYTIDMPWADGRTIDYLLTYTNLDPKDNGYVTTLDKITFDCEGAADTDKYYSISPYANAGVYNEAGEKLYDVLLQKEGDAASTKVTATVCELGTVDHETYEGTPVAITTPGVYVVKVDSMAIGDGNFDPNNPWQTDMGGYTKGRCNPTWTWTFNVVEEIVTVTNVDPATYNVSGEYCDEIPAEVNVTMSSADFTVSSVTARYGMNIVEPLEYSVDGSVLNIKLTDAARAEGQVVVNITATSDKGGAPIVYGSDDDEVQLITLVYQTSRAKLVPESTTPADGETVDELSTIVLDFAENVAGLNFDAEVTLTNENGDSFPCSFDYDFEAMDKINIYLDDPVTAEGTYTLTVPEGFVYNDTYDYGFSDQYGNPQGDIYNPELTYVFYINGTVGITAIKADADGNVKVYTVDGVYVGEGKAADMLNSLQKGVYIVNGTKVAISK